MEDSRFSILSTQEIDSVVSSTISRSTSYNSTWCTKLYIDWSTWRNTCAEKQVPTLEELWTATESLITNSLKHFIFEIRRKDGSEYPGNTLYNIVCGLSRFIKTQRPDCNIMDKENINFNQFIACLDGRMKDLTTRGVGTTRRSADPISASDESIMWNCGAFSLTDGKGLLRTVYFYNSKVFGLRACDEHRKLSLEQITFGNDSDGEYVQFQGRGNKVFSGGIRDRKTSDKCIKQYDTPDNERSVFKIIKEYVSCLHRANIFSGPFYRRPLDNIIPKQPRFSVAPVGVNAIRQLLPKAASLAGIQGNITAHSGKVTCATSLFQKNIDEQLIMSRTGHRSTAVRIYKRKCSNHEKNLSKILESPAPEHLPKTSNRFHFKKLKTDFNYNIEFGI